MLSPIRRPLSDTVARRRTCSNWNAQVKSLTFGAVKRSR